MSYVFSSMESPHWLIVAGAVLLILGVIRLALFGRRDASDYEMASGEEQGRSEPDLAHTQLTIGTQSLRSGKGIDGLVKTVVPRTP